MGSSPIFSVQIYRGNSTVPFSVAREGEGAKRQSAPPPPPPPSAPKGISAGLNGEREQPWSQRTCPEASRAARRQHLRSGEHTDFSGCVSHSESSRRFSLNSLHLQSPSLCPLRTHDHAVTPPNPATSSPQPVSPLPLTLEPPFCPDQSPSPFPPSTSLLSQPSAA